MKKEDLNTRTTPIFDHMLTESKPSSNFSLLKLEKKIKVLQGILKRVDICYF